VCCAQEPSQWKLTNGAWLHRLPSTLSLESEPETEHSPSGIRVRL
jgi:hypothetical protein